MAGHAARIMIMDKTLSFFHDITAPPQGVQNIRRGKAKS